MIMQRKRWQELTLATKMRIVTMGALQFALLGAALWDLSHRTAEEVKGSKQIWVALSFVNFLARWPTSSLAANPAPLCPRKSRLVMGRPRV